MFLFGKDFVIVTDHKPLETIYSQIQTTSLDREMGAENAALQIKGCIQARVSECRRLTIMVNSEPSSISTLRGWPHLLHSQTRNVMCIHPTRDGGNVSKGPSSGYSVNKHQTGLIRAHATLHTDVLKKNSIVGQIFLRGKRIIMPRAAQKPTLMLAHEGHQGIVKK